MADSNIEWTDKVWNPVRGCTKVSPGCSRCYAETFAERFRGVKGHPYQWGFDLRLVPEKVNDPLHWKKPRRVFVNSMSDLFQDGVPDTFIDSVFGVMALCPQHTFQVLTKRAQRMFDYCSARHGFDDVSPKKNVWLGVSAENPRLLNERLPILLETPAWTRFVSLEPLLEYVDIRPFLRRTEARAGLDWVIVGGESGRDARVFDADWARDIRRACRKAGVPCFIKQMGANAYDSDLTASGRMEGLELVDKKGGDPAEWPADLRVREFPVRP